MAHTRREMLKAMSLSSAAATIAMDAAMLEEVWGGESTAPGVGEARFATLEAFINHRPLPELPEDPGQWNQNQRDHFRQRLRKNFGLDVMQEELAKPVMAEQVGEAIEPVGWHYRIRRMKISGVFGMELPVNVYEPTRGRKPFGGFVYVTGHIAPSKEWPEGQQICANLAERGIVAVAMDYFGHGERAQPGNSHGIGTFSYTRLTATGMEVSDAMRVVSYLRERGDVDSKRIGFTGWSGGGHCSHWVGAVDDRVTLVVPCVGTCDYPAMWIRRSLDSETRERNECWHMHMPGYRGHSDIGLAFASIYPRRLRVINEQGEVTFSQENAQPWIARARAVYALLGQPDRVDLRCPNLHHNYDAKKQEQLYDVVNEEFFDGKHDLGKRVLTTPEFAPEELHVGIDTSRTYASAYVDRIQQLPPREVRELPHDPLVARERAETMRKRVQQLLAVDLEPHEANIGRGNAAEYVQGLTIRSGQIAIENFGDQALAIRFWEVSAPAAATSKSLLIVGSPKSTLRSSELVAALANRFRLVFIQPRDDTGVRNALQRYGIFWGRPALGMKVQDVIRSAEALLPPGDIAGIVGLAEGELPWRTGDAGEIALFATLLSKRLNRATVRLSLISYKAEALANPLADDYATVPGVLEEGDLADFVAATAPNAIQLISPLGADTNEVKHYYAGVNDSLKAAYPDASPSRYFVQHDQVDAATILGWHA